MGAGVAVAEPPRRTRRDGVEHGNGGSNGRGREGGHRDGRLMKWVLGCNQGGTVDLQWGRCWGVGASLPEPCLRLLASAPALPRNLQPGLWWGAQGRHRPVPAATLRGARQGHGDIPRDAIVLGSSLRWWPRLSGHLGAQDGTRETCPWQGAGH